MRTGLPESSALWLIIKVSYDFEGLSGLGCGRGVVSTDTRSMWSPIWLQEAFLTCVHSQLHSQAVLLGAAWY